MLAGSHMVGQPSPTAILGNSAFSWDPPRGVQAGTIGGVFRTGGEGEEVLWWRFSPWKLFALLVHPG